MPENFEKFNQPNPENQEKISEQPEIELTPEPEIEMPEDFVEPKGKSGKWGEIVENKELSIRYREKIIELPKHRQQETGIKRIRRRELLPPFPEGFCGRTEEGNFYASGSEKFDETYKFLTDGRYPSDKVIVHMFQLFGGEEDLTERNIQRFREQGFYFQEIFPQEYPSYLLNIFFYDEKEGRMYHQQGKKGEKIGKDTIARYDLICSPKWMYTHWMYYNPSDEEFEYINPVFVFGNRNEAFNNYIDSITNNDKLLKMMPHTTMERRIQGLRQGKPDFTDNYHEWELPCIRHPDVKPLRWCHAELALIPTKRSLNVLFFETGGPKKTDKEK